MIDTIDENFGSTESNWPSWSKVGLLTSHLAKQDVPVDGVTFLRQTSHPYSIHFDYAFFVTVDIRSHLEKIKANNNHKLRNSRAKLKHEYPMWLDFHIDQI